MMVMHVMHPNQMSETKLRIEYAERSWKYEFPECIEEALEDDYVLNHDLYKDGVFEFIAMWCFIHPDITPEFMLERIREYKKT